MKTDLVSVDVAQQRMLAGIDPLPEEMVPLARADGRVLARPLAALRTQPPFAASAMDGYAVIAADATPGRTLTVIGTAPAGRAFSGTVGPGEAVRIFTGAPLPEGADAVVIQENTTVPADGLVRIEDGVPAGRHIRPRGIDFEQGQDLLAAGTRLDWRSLSLAAAMNHATLPVRRRPLVAILATGDELVAPGTEPGPDQIVASNSYGIAALAARWGAEILDLGIAPDDAEAISARVRAAIDAQADVLVTLGGASVGDLDLIRPVLGHAGVDLDFWKLAMRPGKPLMAGRLGSTHVLGLPGNPVSSLVTGTLFLVPLLRALQGEPAPLPVPERAILTTNLPANDWRRDFLRGRLSRESGELTVGPVNNQDSSLLSRLALADALIVRPENDPAVSAGEKVPIIRL